MTLHDVRDDDRMDEALRGLDAADPALTPGQEHRRDALLASLLWPGVGMTVFGVALLTLVAWLLINDVARRTWRAPGQPGFIGTCLMAGYVWLAVAGLIWVLGGPPTSVRAMDATILAVFLGFAISMIMAHATTILPAVLRIALPYRSAFWAPIALLQVALVVRVWIGDGLGMPVAWRIGGVLGVIALVLFVLTALYSALRPPAAAPAAPAVTAATHARAENSATGGGMLRVGPPHRALSSRADGASTAEKGPA